jgi:hypothetical protein
MAVRQKKSLRAAVSADVFQQKESASGCGQSWH